MTITSTVSKFIYPQDHVVTLNATPQTIWPSTAATTSTYDCTKYFWFAYPQSEAFTYFSTVYVTKTRTITRGARSGFTTETYVTRTRTAVRPSISTVYSCNRTLVYVDINTAATATGTRTETIVHKLFTDLTTVCHYSNATRTTSYTPRARTTTRKPEDTRVWTTSITTEIRDNTPTGYVTEMVEDPETKTFVNTWCLNPTTTLYVRTATVRTTVYTATVDRYWDESYCSFIRSSISSEEADLLPESTGAAIASQQYAPLAAASATPTGERYSQLSGGETPVEMVRRQSLGLSPGTSGAGTRMETFTLTLSQISTTKTLIVTAETPSTRWVQECLPSRSSVP